MYTPNIKLEKICYDVLHGAMTPEEAELSFGHKRSQKMAFYCAAHDLAIEIRPKVVINMLNHFLNGKKTPEQLKEWALFILMAGAFATPNREQDETLRYDPMWTILGKLSAPEIDGEITLEIAKKYIKELESIKEEF